MHFSRAHPRIWPSSPILCNFPLLTVSVLSESHAMPIWSRNALCLVLTLLVSICLTQGKPPHLWATFFFYKTTGLLWNKLWSYMDIVLLANHRLLIIAQCIWSHYITQPFGFICRIVIIFKGDIKINSVWHKNRLPTPSNMKVTFSILLSR